MTGQELINCFRELAQDRVVPCLWSDDWILGQLNEGEREACDRARLLFDDSTPAITRLEVKAGQARYVSIDARVIDIVRAFFVTPGSPEAGYWLKLQNRPDLDWHHGTDWRTWQGLPHALIHDGNRSVTLAPMPNTDGTLKLEVYRLPMQTFDLTAEPEIPGVHHKELVHWALYKAFWIPDPDEQNQQRAIYYHGLFEQHFGRHVDARKRRIQHENRPHINKPW